METKKTYHGTPIMPLIPGKFIRQYNMHEIMTHNLAVGMTFFKDNEMRKWGTRIHEDVYTGEGGTFFVTGERFERFLTHQKPIQVYMVREYNPDTGNVTAGIKYPTREIAHNRAKRFAIMPGLYNVTHDLSIQGKSYD